MSGTDAAEDQLRSLRARYLAAGTQPVSIAGDVLADLIGELVRLARVTDDLQDVADDAQDRAEAWRVQTNYLRDVVEHQRRVIALLGGDTEDPEALALQIEADDLVLFSDDSIQAIWTASVITAPPAPDGDDH